MRKIWHRLVFVLTGRMSLYLALHLKTEGIVDVLKHL